MDYAFAFEGHGVFTPDGKVDVPAKDVAASNKAKEQAEIEWLKTHPDKMFLYVKQSTPTADWSIVTWLGTVVSTRTEFGARAYVGFGFRGHTYRRSVRCVIFGQRYHGWYLESSGDYCRLSKSK